MGSLLAQVVPLAAGAAVSPGLLALQMLNLSRPSGGMARAWSVLAGAAAVVLAVSVGALFVTVSLGDLGRDQTLRAVIRLVAAVVLVGVAVYELLHPAQGPRKPADTGAPEPGERRHGPVYVASAGLGAALVAPNMALYLPAAHEIARSTVSAPGKVVAFAVAAGVALLPVAGPPLLVTVLGDRVRPALEALNGFVTRNSRVVTIVACLGFAVYLTVTGIVGLAG